MMSVLALSFAFNLAFATPISLFTSYKIDTVAEYKQDLKVCKITINSNNKNVILTQTAGTEPNALSSYKSNITYITDNLSCKNTLTQYIKNGWEIISTYNSYDNGLGSQYSNIVLANVNETADPLLLD